jgi:uncharacterized membrane protein
MTTLPTTHRAVSARWVPYALVVLGLFPALSGSLRLGELAGGPHIMPANPGIDASPWPMIIHLVTVIPYVFLGAFQFSSGLRRRRPGWHRLIGRVLVPLGLAVAASGLWMTLAYPTKPGTGVLLYGVRLVVGTGMAAGIVLGLAAIRRGDIARHLAWMTRAYALGLGAGTQMVTGAVQHAWLGTGVLANDLAMSAAWAINLAVAEYAIRRTRRNARPRSTAVAIPEPSV